MKTLVSFCIVVFCLLEISVDLFSVTCFLEPGILTKDFLQSIQVYSMSGLKVIGVVATVELFVP